MSVLCDALWGSGTGSGKSSYHLPKSWCDPEAGRVTNRSRTGRVKKRSRTAGATDTIGSRLCGFFRGVAACQVIKGASRRKGLT